MKSHHIVIFYSKEDAAYIAEVPDLKYCSASGDTPEEALREVLIAQRAWLAVQQQDGGSLPLDSYTAQAYRDEPLPLTNTVT